MGVLASNQITKTNFAAAQDTLVLDVANLSTVRFEFSGTYSFTAVFEALGIDGTTWFPMQVVMVNAATVATSHATANATQAYEASCNSVAKVRIRLSAFTSAGTHSVGIAATTAEIEPAPVVQMPTTQSFATPTGSAISVTSAASTNASSQKTSAGSLFEISADNMTAAAKFVKLYNKASAPTVGTDVPVLTIPIPANGHVALAFGANGKRFTTGIAMAITGAQPVADTTATAAGDVHVHGTYI